MATLKKTHERRKPRQQRSQQRVADIIDAAGQLLEEVGYAELTTNAIAAKASTSIGSLYQFFPNKEAVVAELVKEFRAEIRLLFNHSLSVQLARRSPRQFVDVVVDGIEGVRQRMPGFSSVFSFRKFGGTFNDQRIQLEADIMMPLSALLAEAYPEIPEDRRAKCMTMVAEATKVLMSKIANESLENQVWMREEVKCMLGLYLESRLLG